MMLSITNAVHDVLKKHFEIILLAGYFPEINYQKDEHSHSYNMVEYATTWAKFVKVVDKRIEDTGLDKLGAFSRKRSKDFIYRLQLICEGITPDDITNSTERFHTIFD
jgi:hypothetical protein